ncbi:MAG: SH3 domain-containing protein, partial [Planctomycetota bacterium]
MVRISIALLAAAVLMPVILPAAESAAPVHAPPYWAKSLGDRVAIRRGPTTGHDILGHLAKGERVFVLELAPTKPEETPWLRVRLPSSASVWVFGRFVEADVSGAARIRGKQVQLRASPGQKESPLGTIEEPAPVRILERAAGEGGDWVRIVPPDEAAAYVRSDLLEFVETETEAAQSVVERARREAVESALRQRFESIGRRIRGEEAKEAKSQEWDSIAKAFEGLLADVRGTGLEPEVQSESGRVAKLAETVRGLRAAAEAERKKIIEAYEAKLRALGPDALRIGWVYRLERPRQTGAVRFGLEMAGECV